MRGLFSSSARVQRHTCHRIHAWSLRGTAVPLPLQATMQLVEAALLDASQGATQEQVRLAYSAAIVRVVNGSVEEMQRGEFAQSVSSLAAKLGLPKWIVDVRHEATHNAMPSIQVLRMAWQAAMEWLQGKYWAPQAAKLLPGDGGALADVYATLARCVESGNLLPESGPAPLVHAPPGAEEGVPALSAKACCELLANAPDVKCLLGVLASVDAALVAEWAEPLHWLDEAWGGCLAELFCAEAGDLADERLLPWVRLVCSRAWQARKRPELWKGDDGKKRSASLAAELAHPSAFDRALLLEVLARLLRNPGPPANRALARDVVLHLLGAASKAQALDALFLVHDQLAGSSPLALPPSAPETCTWAEMGAFCDALERGSEAVSLADLHPGGSQPWVAVVLPPSVTVGSWTRGGGKTCPGLSLVPDPTVVAEEVAETGWEDGEALDVAEAHDSPPTAPAAQTESGSQTERASLHGGNETWSADVVKTIAKRVKML
jgi:hypothetical protein